MALFHHEPVEMRPNVNLYGHDLSLPPIGLCTLFTSDKEVTPESVYEITIKDLFQRYDKFVIFGIPGAFTPVCTMEHCPTFVQYMGKFKEQGITVGCLSTDNAFVLGAFAKHLKLDKAGIMMLSDPYGRFLEAIGRVQKEPMKSLGLCSTRFAMYVVNGRVRAVTEGDVESTGALGILREIETKLSPSEKIDWEQNTKKPAIQSGMEKVFEKASDAYHSIVGSAREETAHEKGPRLGAEQEAALGNKAHGYPYSK
jgi:peroxiredoxin